MACEGPQGPANQKAPVTGQNYKRQTQPPDLLLASHFQFYKVLMNKARVVHVNKAE